MSCMPLGFIRVRLSEPLSAVINPLIVIIVLWVVRKSSQNKIYFSICHNNCLLFRTLDFVLTRNPHNCTKLMCTNCWFSNRFTCAPKINPCSLAWMEMSAAYYTPKTHLATLTMHSYGQWKYLHTLCGWKWILRRSCFILTQSYKNC